MDLTQPLQISIYLNTDVHDNGMTLKEYADAVLAGTSPILGHDDFSYQFGATEADMKLVSNWATANGLEIILAESAIATIQVRGSIEQLGNLFSITLKEVTDEVRTYITHEDPIIIPSEIASVVREVKGFDQSFLAVKHAVPFDITDPNVVEGLVAVTPVQMNTAYSVPSASNGYGGCIGLYELTYSGSPEGWQQPDVTASFSRIGLTAPTVTTVIVGGVVSVNTTSTAESMLDIYCAGAAAPQAKIAYYLGQNGGIYTDVVLAAVNDTVNNPSVLSISWGIGDGTYYDTAFQSCVVKGITVFVSSGDSGAVNLSMAQTGCSQYAVICGGTRIVLNGSNQITSEVAWSGSGGGQSSSIPVPSWQSGLTVTTITASSTGSPTALAHRGVPDFSAPADPSTGYQFYIGGTSGARGYLAQYGGTSASAPYLAGLWVGLSCLLGRRIPFNMSTWYSNSTTLFRDITSGNNRNGYTTGYTTTVGWDAVTGLGTPKADQIYKLFNVGSSFPKQNYGFRTSGAVYPRPKTSASRH
jgi:kumamolisin